MIACLQQKYLITLLGSGFGSVRSTWGRFWAADNGRFWTTRWAVADMAFGENDTRRMKSANYLPVWIHLTPSPRFHRYGRMFHGDRSLTGRGSDGARA